MLIERLPRARTREGSAKRDLAGRATYRRSPGPFQGLRGGTMSDEKIPRVLPRDVPDYHSRQALTCAPWPKTQRLLGSKLGC